MTRLMMMTAAVALAGSMASAQATTQTATLGASGDPVYTDQIQGANGVVYNCLPGTTQVNGQTVRQCVPDSPAQLGGLNAGAATAAGIAGVVLIAAIANDSDGTAATTTTN